MSDTATRQAIYVRAVNGDGPRCEKCGDRSALHVGERKKNYLPPDAGMAFFLCALCTIKAVERFMVTP